MKSYYCKCERRRLYWKIFYCFLFLVSLFLFVILIIFLVLHPTKPKFSLQDATIYQFNITNEDSYHLTTTVQVTLSSRNPNDRIGIYYDKFDVYIDYKSQQITLPTAINAAYQGQNDATIWSPFLYGFDIPVAPYLCSSVTQDQTAGLILFHVKMNGRLRWKVGNWISGNYHINVNCPAFMTVDNTGGGGSPSFKFQQITKCNVDV